MKDYKYLLRVLKQQVKPALGCTEPVAVAWAVAKACRELKGRVEKINIIVSLNLYKNGMAVGIPGTKERGLEIAAALGAISGDPNKDLEVLEGVKEEDVKKARKLVEEGRVQVTANKKLHGIYIDCEVKSLQEKVRVIVEGGHTNLTAIYHNDELIWQQPKTEEEEEASLSGWTIKEIREKVLEIPVEELEFLMDGVNMNLKVAELGLKNRLGLKVGATLKDLMEEGLLDDNVINRAKMLSAAAADARMSGIKEPVMSSAGSGNHGIGAIIPLAVMAQENNWTKDKLLRAVALSHLVTYYIKEYTGKLSPICGCSIAAGVGAGASIVWGLGGDDRAIEAVIKNIIGDLAGMVCDGAKGGCALKLTTSTGKAITAAYLALRGVSIEASDGIIGKTAEDTIENLGRLSREGMAQADEVILDIMLEKNKRL
ncbi:L-cysteine desulfidase [Thermoanaerobacter uzonensis DSM 18761]|jgi:L-cysteine desulfidase|uniref:UPF0597 protein SAMN02745195_00429 n=1 Tax=Thermoanaerobacter uzonensis DSM 18761 TaxID=1123369 RepID=A0A1M4TNU5_9THEO|nr:L-serine ammonia-lyase, iron-sulfur-dependent, subunit alpha [Thermoanaerobacter uzonensis]SHE46113.1 L-cysteine desulfidase [Thermoanaerobacter uzonensis DSM 18761]